MQYEWIAKRALGVRHTLLEEKQTLSSTVTSNKELVCFIFTTEGRPRFR